MKQSIDKLVVSDEKLQSILKWLDEKAQSIEAPYKSAAVRAYYLELELARLRAVEFAHEYKIIAYKIGLNLSRKLDLKLQFGLEDLLIDLININHPLALIRDLARTLALDVTLEPSTPSRRILDLDPKSSLNHDLIFSQLVARDCELRQKLQVLISQLPNEESNSKKSEQWWKASSQAWMEQLREVMIEHRNIGHDWQFGDSQKELLGEYYDANNRLVDCLNSDCYISREVRQEIEDTLLLPMSEIEKRQQGRVG
jgi:hypothetical protein